MSYRIDPQFKVTVGSTEYINDQAMSMIIRRPENNVSSCSLVLNDYKSKNYVDVFTQNTEFSVSLRYGSDTWTKVFGGYAYEVKPAVSIMGELLAVNAWGYEYGLQLTHADTSWGSESRRHRDKNTPQEILVDILNNYAIKSLDGAASNWPFGNGINNVHAGCSVNYLNSDYLDCFNLINRVCEIVSAWAQTQAPAEPGIHWFCDPDAGVIVKELDTSNVIGGFTWTRYWKDALTTLEVTKDMILYDFTKTSEDYTNDVLFASAFRMPPEDYWTELQNALGGSQDWGVSSANLKKTDDATYFVVGDDSLRLENEDVAIQYAYYPSGQAAGWDLTRIGSEKTPSTLSFYARTNDIGHMATFTVNLWKDAGNWWYPYSAIGSLLQANDKWEHFTLPIGDYHQKFLDDYRFQWYAGAGSIDWDTVNCIRFALPGGGDEKFIYIDDLHFSGQVVRRAYDSDDWAAPKCDRQKVIRNDTALHDVLSWNTDSGTIARLACAALKRGMASPTVGMIQIPLTVDILPGHQLHIHACQKADSTYRIDKDEGGVDDVWRVKEVIHNIRLPHPSTIVDLTNDVMNSHALGVSTIAQILQENFGTMRQMEARDLKSSASLDNLIPRLEKNY